MRQRSIPSVPEGKLRSAAWTELNWPFSHSRLITISSALRSTALAMGSACAPSTTRRTPIWRCAVTSRRCSRKGRPWKGSSAFGEPIRLEAPPDRMTAASICSLSALVHDDHVTRRIRTNLFERVLVTSVDFVRHRKALFVGERFAVIYHADPKARGAGRLCNRRRDVTAAKQVHDRLRQNWLNKNL